MDKWPQEIYDHVVSFLEKRVGEADVPVWEHHTLPFALPAVAAVSRKFQYAVERRTFDYLNKKVSDTEIEKFEQILTPRRRYILRELMVTILLPTYPRESYGKFETDEDRQANNAAATATLRRLFEFIRSCDADTPDDEVIPSLHLRIDGVFSLTDKRSKLLTKDEIVQFGLWPDLHDLRYRFSLLNMTSDGTGLPTLPCVRHFTLAQGPRYWSPAVAALLTSKMPNVQTVRWNLELPREDWGLYYSLDKIYRNELVTGIRSIKLPKSIKTFDCKIAPLIFRDKHQKLPEFIEPGTDDPVGLALRESTKHCMGVELSGSLGPSVFDASIDTQRANGELCWQNTTDLRVMVHMCSPDGTWLFDVESEDPFEDDNAEEVLGALDHLPPGYGATDEAREEAEEYFDDHRDFLLEVSEDDHDRSSRSVPNDDKMNAFLTAFARRCSLMPALQVATLEAEYDNPDSWPFQVSCAAPGEPFSDWDTEFADGTDSWRVYLHVHDWRPTEATLDAFKAIGKGRDGQEPTICFLPWGTFDG
ncbi:hypothetical protein HD806DRAFT_513835 [Xylariaceae sp. AK1471]|nr:hypothetical protein HD806DRAFT_513835 [Xylariaceae sp. AK1471]